MSRRLDLFCNNAELNDCTQVAYSNALEDGTIEVAVERPVELGFDSATCVLPLFPWEHVEGLCPDELERLDTFVHNNAQLILRFAREAA